MNRKGHLVWVFLVLISLYGCAHITEAGKGFLGISTKILEDNRNSALKKDFNYDYFTAYTQASDILKRMETHAYAGSIKKHMIAVYLSDWDTTPVGVFFSEIGANNTRIEVSSPSTYAKEYIADKLFSVLDKKLTIEEVEAKVHEDRQKEAEAREDMGN